MKRSSPRSMFVVNALSMAVTAPTPVSAPGALVLMRRRVRGNCMFSCICLATLFGGPDTIHAASLFSGNSEARLDPRATLTLWQLNDDPDNVFVANFYFRTDTLTSPNGGEVDISGLGTVAETPLGPDSVQYEAANSDLGALQTWSLTGGAAGSGDSSIESTITLTNLSDSTIPLDLFFAADFDIAFDQANPNDETTALSNSSVEVFDPVTLAQIVSEVSPGAESYQVYEGQFEVLFNFFQDVDGITTLGNTPGIGTTVVDEPGVTDAGHAFGWTLDLAPGESITATASNVQSVVPEPSSFSLLAAGLFALRLGRLRRA